MENIDLAWESFMAGNYSNEIVKEDISDTIIPKPNKIYISTKTIITYLNNPEILDITNLFWNLPIIDYYDETEGILKKQIKMTCFTKEEVEEVDERLKDEPYYSQTVIKVVDNPRAKIKYKHVQKVNIGTCNKDIIRSKKKKKGAFYNCIAMILRILIDDTYKEVHVKLFNTGKLEIPGIQNDDMLFKTLNKLIEIITPLTYDDVTYQSDKMQTVLINSNFNCGYFINRSILHDKLKMKYNIISMFDPCSYPGIQSKFYYNKMKDKQDGVCRCSSKCSKGGIGFGDGECIEVSFMIFRTGSILIVGNCEEYILHDIYDFLVKVFHDEYHEINEGNIEIPVQQKSKNHKPKTILIEE